MLPRATFHRHWTTRSTLAAALIFAFASSTWGQSSAGQADAGHHATSATSQQNAAAPTPALLTEISDWLAANFDLPAARGNPRVEFVPPMRLTAMRYKGVLPQGWREDSIENPTVQAAYRRDVLAVYDDKSKTIFLPSAWAGTTPGELSVLVHEMVHHLQNVAQLKYDCPAAREKLAYQAQNRWLERFAKNLEEEFEIDMLTLLVSSGCFR